jgi:hypothetical protein
MRKPLIFIVIFLLLVVVVSIFFISSCDHETGWRVGPQVTCTCRGLKITTRNDLPVDGDRVSYCIGVIEQKDCVEYKEGVAVICEGWVYR